MAIDPFDSNILFLGGDIGVYKSTDAGANWYKSSDDLQGLFVGSIALDAYHPGIIYVATFPGGVYKSIDAGASWSPTNNGITSLNGTSLAIDPTDPLRLYYGTVDAGVFQTQDGGANWTQINRGLTNLDVNVLLLDPLGSVLCAGTYGNGVFCADLKP